MEELRDYVTNFMSDNDISCEEDIYQSKRIQGKLEEFMCECYNIVKDHV